MEVFLKLK